MLCSSRSLGQVDRKFILAVAGGSVMAVDQHAADERVRLESLEAALAQQVRKCIAYGRRIEHDRMFFIV